MTHSRRHRMYSDLAPLWPLISPPADYGDEARHWKAVLRDQLGSGRHQLLELGVGGGNLLSHLTDEFDAAAVDLSPGMLEHSKALNTGVEHHVGDMRTVRLGHTFDAVLIHDAVAHLTTVADLDAMLETAVVHLRPGGVLVLAPDHVTETFIDGEVNTEHTRADDGRELVYTEYLWDPDPTDTQVEAAITYIIRDGTGVRVEADHHSYGLFPLATWFERMERAGFRAFTWEYPVTETGDHWLLVGKLADA